VDARFSSGAAPAAIPTLTEIQTDPSLLERLPLGLLLDLRRHVRLLGADLEMAIDRQVLRANGQPARHAVLDVETAAKRLGTSCDSLYRKRKRLRLGYVDPLDGKLKFTEEEISEYIRRQRRA
jgi:hypothetical protein